MNKYVIAIILLFPLFCFAQTKEQLKIIEEFKTSSNDSIFARKYSAYPVYSYTVLSFPNSAFDSEVDSFIFSQKMHSIVGPLETDSFNVWMKVISIDSSMRMRVGNIWIDGKKISEDSAKLKAQIVLDKAFKSNDFNSLCQKYSDDQIKKKDCDLGWACQGMYVPEFEREVLKHMKGDIFSCKTVYGYHVVKVIENSYKERYKVICVPLYLRK